MSENKSIDDVKNIFQKEFWIIGDRFAIINLPLSEAETSKAEDISKPGVYVFWNREQGVIKVGRHLANSRIL